MKIGLLPGLRFHSEQYINIINSQKEQLDFKVYSSSPLNKFNNLSKKSYKFIPLPFKIFSRILKINTSVYFKMLDSNIYENLSSYYLNKYNPDIIHAWATFAQKNFSTSKKKLKILERSCPHVISQIKILSDEYHKLKLKYNKPNKIIIEKQLSEYELADKIIVPSQFTKKSFLENGIKESKIEVINLSSNKAIKYSYKKNFKNKLIYGFCGGAIIRKGLIYILKSWEKKKEIEGEELWLRCDKENIKSIPIINDICSKRKDIKIISYSKNLNNFFSSINVLIHPAIEEGFGMVVIESIKYGVPVAITNMVGAIDLIDKKHFLPISLNIEKDITELFKFGSNYYLQISQNIKKDIDKYNSKSSLNKLINIYR